MSVHPARSELHLPSYSSPHKFQNLPNSVLSPYKVTRAFAQAGPDEWNKLPNLIRKCASLSLFKINLKPYFFQTYYYYYIIDLLKAYITRCFCARLFFFMRARTDSLV